MLKQIQYFQAVVRCGSFTEAAEECFISQSAISQQIKALEEKLGVQLLERKNRKFSLTPAGEYFYQKSLVLLADYESIRCETVKIANKDKAELKIGYLKEYVGQEFKLSVARFSERYPNVSVQMIGGNHEDLYEALKNGSADLVLNDQRRAFSDEYVNLMLTTRECYVELSARHPLASLVEIEADAIKALPCILVTSAKQQETERIYYQEILGIRGDFLYTESLEEAKLLAISGKGYSIVDGEDAAETTGNLCRMKLIRSGKPVKRNYCAFWKADNAGYYVEAFAEILKEYFA